ncbi:uncharacterized protein BROUX77_002043 [Berkeleyomyces rouxiae]|uniref:uncharacterized protein n=1 Tax=Berkeleyomyces rouxiae TaxID=2035830 RepID=UPI003B81039F
MGHYEDESQVFMYHPEHRQLHDTFWKTIDEIFKSKGVTGIKNKRKALQLSYTIGFLMRYAFMPNTGLEPTKEDIVTPTSHPEYYARLESFARTSLMVKNYPGTPLESISNVIDEWKYNAKRTRPGKVIWKIKNVAREIILGMMT